MEQFDSTEYSDAELEEMYPKYCAYIKELGDDRGRVYPPREKEDFKQWFSGLQTRKQRALMESFEQGLQATLAEGRAQVGALLMQRKAHLN